MCDEGTSWGIKADAGHPEGWTTRVADMVRLACALALVTLGVAACSGDDVGPGPASITPGPSKTSVPGPSASTGHVDNPFAGAQLYVNEAWSAKALETAAEYQAKQPELAAAMEEVATQPTAVWLDRIAAIEGSEDAPGLKAHLDAALAQATSETPMVVTVVVYDLPGRDCFALASNGELPADSQGMSRYKNDYINPIASILADDAYADLRIVAIIEPDSLPNLVTNANTAACQTAAPYYKEGITYALDAFAPLDNVYTYLDAAHSGWLGWDNNAAGSVNLFSDVVRGTKAGFASIDGFAINTANYTPTEEPFLTDPNRQVGSGPVKQASFYEFNPLFDETDWAADLYRRAIAAGFPSHIGIVLDTSRNGWGGEGRPRAISTSTQLDTFVQESTIDGRTHRGAWCNQDGAGLGLRPQALPSGYPDAHLDAYLWIKPPGDSDGSSKEIANDEGKGFDKMCQPGFVTDRLGGKATGALADAPVSGHWFAAQFAQLVANAYPAVGEKNPPPRDEPNAGKPVADAGAGAGGPNDGQTGGHDGGQGGGQTGGQNGASGGEKPPTQTSGKGDCVASFALTNTWEGGFQVDVTVTASVPVDGWTVGFTLPSGVSIDQMWNGEASAKSGTIAVSDAGWNGQLAKGGTGAFGFTGKGQAPTDDVSLTCAAE